MTDLALASKQMPNKYNKGPQPRLPDFLICLTLLLSTFAVYAQVRHFDFVNLDDSDYTSGALQVRRGITIEGLKWAFTSGDAANWFPVTWISHMLDCQLFGLNSGWHHLVNVLIHGLAALLLFASLRRATGARWRSAFVAFLFALHPLHVESVAWVAERKDGLSTFFGLLTLWAYARYAAGRNIEHRIKEVKFFYGLALVFFALGLLSKPMLVTLPCVMLLLDWWPLGRIQNAKLKMRGRTRIDPQLSTLNYQLFGRCCGKRFLSSPSQPCRAS